MNEKNQTNVRGSVVSNSSRSGRTAGRGLAFLAIVLALGVGLADPAGAWGFGGGPRASKKRRAFSQSSPALQAKISQTPTPEPQDTNRPPAQADRKDAADPNKPVLVTPQGAEGATGKPVIAVDEITHDFGTVWVGPILKHEFTITNKGDSPLQITKVRPACGCTIAGTYPRELKTGESGKFPFSLDSSKLRGKFEKAITISSNDTATPELRIKLAGECKRYVEVTPSAVNFSRVTDLKQEQERKIAITSNTDTPVTLTVDPTQTITKLAYELTEKVPGKEFELTVRLKPPMEPGTLRDTITLTSNVEAQKTLQIPVTAVIPDRLEVQPAELVIGAAAGAASGATAPASRVVRYTNNGEKLVRVLKAEADDEKLTLKVNQQEEGKTYTIHVSWPADYEVPPSGKTITLSTDDPEKPTITIPVKASRIVQKDAQKPPTPAEQLVGKPAPPFSLKTTEGKPLSNTDLANTVTVLNFFAPNCGFCKKQMPRVETIRPDYVAKGVRFVNVAQSMRGKAFPDEEIVKILKDLGVNSELAIDMANTSGPLFGAGSFPTMVVLGKTGRVETVNVGNVGELESRLRGQLDALLADKPIPQEFQASAKPKPQQPETPKKDPALELIGKPAPQVTLTTLEGKPLSNDEFAKVPATVLNFVAPTCGFCKKQLPRIEALKADYAAKGVRFVNVSETMGNKVFTNDQIVETFKGAGSTNEIAPDPENKIGQAYQARGYPTMVIVGKSGKVEAVNIGNVGDLETRMKGQLDAIIEGKPVPVFADAKPAETPQRPALTMVGQPAPQFTINTLDGKTVTSAEFPQHSATILNFVAPNCGFCKKQLPVLETIRKEYEAKGVRFVNVSQTMRQEFTNEQVVEVMKNAGSNIELAKDDGNKIGQMFKATSYPTMVVVGKDGKIAHVNIGAAADLDKQLRQQLDNLIAGKPAAPPAAGTEGQKKTIDPNEPIIRTP